MKPAQRYQLNICGGDFKHVRECFRRWKDEPLVYSRNETMFAGREEVKRLSGAVFDTAEKACAALRNACGPDDDHAWAVEVDDGERDMWVVMAVYQGKV